MGRPKADKTRSAAMGFRAYPEIREAIETYAKREHRTVAQTIELLLREAIIARRKRDKESAKEIEDLP
jgi:hypothetical protein